MNDQMRFRIQIQRILDEIGPETLAYDADEFWMIQHLYEYVERYARERQLTSTAIALPLVRGLHNGVHRKSSIMRDGIAYRLPYVIHCLQVCRMLINLQLPLPRDEEDVVLASALCHDLIEDVEFAEGGREMTTQFHLDPRVYETVKCVSKRKDFTEEEHRAYFRGIQENPLALLVKLSDRGNNVEDLYNMSVWKTHEYVEETKTYFFPMVTYGREHYGNLSGVLQIMNEKIKSLTQMGEILVNRYEEQERRMNEKLIRLREENQRLRGILKQLEEEEES